MHIILTALMAFTIAFTGSLTQATQAPSQAPFKGLTQVVQEQRAQAPSFVACEEDMPCWDCQTMGNLICGPTQAPTQASVEAPAPMEVITAPEQPTAAPEPVYTAPSQPYTAPTVPKTLPQVATQPVQPVQPIQPVQAPVATCTAPTLMAEDGSCVNPNFWGDPKGVTPTVNPTIPAHAEPAPTPTTTGSIANVRNTCVDKLTIGGPPAPNECVSR